MNACTFCGRENDAGSRFCIDCGKPLSPSVARTPGAPAGTAEHHITLSTPRNMQAVKSGSVTAPKRAVSSDAIAAPGGPASSVCPQCAGGVDPSLPYCPHCGTRLADPVRARCETCGHAVDPAVDLFCRQCGSAVALTATTPSNGTDPTQFGRRGTGPKLARLGETGEPTANYTLERGEAVIGRGNADIRFPDDTFMSPLHARIDQRLGTLWLRDLGSRNGSWVFIDQPTRLNDGDVLLVGSQFLRFRRLGYPGPRPPEADATRRMGSLTPAADVGVLEQLRADGSVRDTMHLSPARTVVLGRETGDWLFPYDQTMSSRHAEVRSEDGEFFVHDLGSRNGVAMSVRGERPLSVGQRVLLGDQLLRVESV